MLNWINRKMKRKGFTLIELVIVIAILGILIAIAAPRLLGFRDTAAVAADEASAETIVKAAELYVATYNVDPSVLEGSDSEWYDKLKDMIDDNYTPQQEGYKGFKLIYKEGGEFEVELVEETTP